MVIDSLTLAWTPTPSQSEPIIIKRNHAPISSQACQAVATEAQLTGKFLKVPCSQGTTKHIGVNTRACEALFRPAQHRARSRTHATW